eukprot:TRINITY_DN744_c0_g1_i1.p1 TRINITY_DN744_c0_g1~~TRINITY_DN744_c0_g1_i1.p1  ORF type:complete len:193 (-),score=34.09 TRINITY_DN744_c0_g1_i1:99-677(-)
MLGRLDYKRCAFFLCDIQTRFSSLIDSMSSVVHVAKTMSDTSRTLDIPLVVTEQYPRAFGNTVPEIDLDNAIVQEKTQFSMVTGQVQELIESGNIDSVVLFGIEAHVCVQQTALDLKERGLNVHVLVDGTSSQRSFDRKYAFKRLENSGVILTTSESVLFELLKDSTHPKFKEISKILKVHRLQDNTISPNL